MTKTADDTCITWKAFGKGLPGHTNINLHVLKKF